MNPVVNIEFNTDYMTHFTVTVTYADGTVMEHFMPFPIPPSGDNGCTCGNAI